MIKIIGRFLLVSSLTILPAFANESDHHPSSDAASGIDLDALADRGAREERDAPEWVVVLRDRTVGSYFPAGAFDNARSLAQARERLRADAEKLLDYFERDPVGEDRARVSAGLGLFVKTLNKRKLWSASPVETEAVRAVKDWTLEETIAVEHLRTIYNERGFFRRAAELMTGDHFLGATTRAVGVVLGGMASKIRAAYAPVRAHKYHRVVPFAAVLAGTGLVTWITQHYFQSSFLTGLIVGGSWGAIQAGPLAELVNASTSWFLTPTTDYLRRWNARYTGDAEQAINNAFDRLQPSDTTEDSFDQMRVATVEKDGADGGGMSPDQQVRNWNKALRWFVAVAKTYGRLNRDTHHHGRNMVTLMWMDELRVAHIAESLENRLLGIDTYNQTLLMPYRLTFHQAGQAENMRSLSQIYARLVDLSSRQTWGNLTAGQLGDLRERIHADLRALLNLGVLQEDVEAITAQLVKRAQTITVLVTSLATNEMKYFFYAESNRNMESEAREAQRAIRRGLRLQTYVDRYRSEVQAVHRAMGFENGPACETALMPAPAYE